jgi:hypothetical protein
MKKVIVMDEHGTELLNMNFEDENITCETLCDKYAYKHNKPDPANVLPDYKTKLTIHGVSIDKDAKAKLKEAEGKYRIVEHLKELAHNIFHK